MNATDQSQFVKGLQQAWHKEQISERIYRALAQREANEVRRNVLLKLAETEQRDKSRKPYPQHTELVPDWTGKC